jgi:hypothetical protein
VRRFGAATAFEGSARTNEECLNRCWWHRDEYTF